MPSGMPGQIVDLYSWLRKQPQPALVVAYLGDGTSKNIPAPLGGRKWRDWLDTIETYEPYRVEALDAEGNVLRTGELGEPPEQSTELPAAGKNQSTLVLLGQMLTNSYHLAIDAYEKGAASARASSDLANARLLELISLLMQRLTMMERFLSKQHAETMRAIEDAGDADKPDDPMALMAQMAAQFMGGGMAGMMGGGSGPVETPPPSTPPASNGQPNGKAPNGKAGKT